MKRLHTTGLYLLYGTLFLLLCLNATAYHKDRVVPVVNIEDDEVIIKITTHYPSADMKLYLSYEDEVKQVLNAFPDYRYTLADKKEFTNHHEFRIPIAPKSSESRVRSVPTGVVTHFRVSCIMYIDKKARYIRSKDYTFRVISLPDGTMQPGLCFTRTPVVANVFGDKATISWETNYPSQTRFIYYREGQEIPTVIEDKTLHRRVEIMLEGLREDSVYYYQIECLVPEKNDKFMSPKLKFRSAEDSADFTFAVMGDSRAYGDSIYPDAALNGVNVHDLSELSRLAYVSGARFILFSGDLISGYTDDVRDVHLQYETWCDAVAPVNAYIPFYSAMGNHDTSAPWRTMQSANEGEDEEKSVPYPETIWADFFVLPKNAPGARKNMPPYTENVYSFDYGNCHFVCLNSDYNYVKDAPGDSELVRNIDKVQRDWLEVDLQKSLDSRYIFVLFHQPAYPTDGHYKSSLDRLPTERDAVWDILDKYKVDAVFVGHEHIYTRLLVDKSINSEWDSSIWQITSGRAGAPWYRLNRKVPWINNVKSHSYAPGFVRLEVNGGKVLCKAYDIHGNVVDEFVMKDKKRSPNRILGKPHITE